MIYTHTIKAWHPALLNQLLHQHWAAAGRRKASDRAILTAELNAKIPKAKGKRRLTLEWIMAPRNRQPDVDGLFKSLLDGLVKGGFLVDDSPEWLDVMPVVFSRGPVKGVKLTLEDV